MTFGLVDVGYSLPKGQAVKSIFVAPCLSSDFLHFIHGSTIGFSVKNERLITVKKKVNFSCISTSSAVSAAPYIF